jgi:hypothetical protein
LRVVKQGKNNKKMHGRKKILQTEQEKKVLQEKAETYSTLVQLVWSKIRNQEYSSDALAITGLRMSFFCLAVSH